MQSFEQRYYLRNPGFTQKLVRDARFFLETCQFILLWATKGRRLRKALREAQKNDSQIILERFLEEEKL